MATPNKSKLGAGSGVGGLPYIAEEKDPLSMYIFVLADIFQNEMKDPLVSLDFGQCLDCVFSFLFISEVLVPFLKVPIKSLPWA